MTCRAPHDDQMRLRAQNGLKAHLSGRLAESATMQTYMERGAEICAERWRGQSGEIDLIVQDQDELVFCEVKKARTHDAAVARLSAAQQRRIVSAAVEYIGTRPELAFSPMRFDLATVDAHGQVHILLNAFGEF